MKVPQLKNNSSDSGKAKHIKETTLFQKKRLLL